MKQNLHAKLLILGLLVIGLLIINCERSGKPREVTNEPVEQKKDEKVALQLLEYFNRQLPDIKFKTDLEKSMVKPDKNSRYRVTFKNFSLTGDIIKGIKNFNKSYFSTLPFLASIPDLGEQTLHFEELIIVFGPKEKYLHLHSIKGMSYEHHFSDEKEWKIGGFTLKRLRYSIGNMTRNVPGANSVKKNGKGEFPENTMSSRDTMESFKIEMIGLVGKENNLTILLEIGTVGNIDKRIEDPKITVYTVKPDTPVPDLSIFLQKGLAVYDNYSEIGKINLIVVNNGNQVVAGTATNISLSDFIKPDGTGNFFKYGFGFGIKNLKLSIPGKKEIELLCNIEEFQFNISMEHLNSEVVMAYIDNSRKRAQAKSISFSTIQEVISHTMKISDKITRSKPLLKLSILPFKHFFGELSLEVNIRLVLPPTGEIKLKILKIDEVLNKLKESRLFPPHIMMVVWQMVDRFTVREKNGDASMTIEFKAHHPGKIFLNSVPVVINPMMLPLMKEVIKWSR